MEALGVAVLSLVMVAVVLRLVMVAVVPSLVMMAIILSHHPESGNDALIPCRKLIFFSCHY